MRKSILENSRDRFGSVPIASANASEAEPKKSEYRVNLGGCELFGVQFLAGSGADVLRRSGRLSPRRGWGFHDTASLQPSSEFTSFDLPGSQGKGLKNGFFFGGFQGPPIDSEENISRHKSGAFVSIQKRVIFDDALGGGRCHLKKRRVAVWVEMDWPIQGRFQQTLVPNPREASKPYQQFTLNCKNSIPRKPVWPATRFHFANSRSALR